MPELSPLPSPSVAAVAHSLAGRPESEWEPLLEHAGRVGDRAAEFAARFGAADAARLAGYLHDIGKVSAEFQAYVRQRGASPDHSTAGAKVADALFKDGAPQLIGRLVAFAIAGHHAGLADGSDLLTRLRRDVPDFGGWDATVPALPERIVPELGGRSGASPGYQLSFLGRMIFSCLVDADFLETERFYEHAEGRVPARGAHADLAELRRRLDRHLATFGDRTGELNRRRAEILAHARGKAELSPGLFTMTVPTGGGKTLAGLAFALDHAIRHGLDRVVYVIPYTSIIEQTASVFREALADDGGGSPDVLEHTGTVDWDAIEREQQDEGARDAVAKLRRAAENWDVPVVVTTAVQFFESLHANRTSRCRKLHNLAKSLIVLDEAQTLPIALLRPCMAAIDELAAAYGASVVLCTATQPALRVQDAFSDGLDIPADRELGHDPPDQYLFFSRRTTVSHAGDVTDAELADRFASRTSMLCVVNSRKHAQALFELIKPLDGSYHLSTLMCAAHRRQVLTEIRQRLLDRHPVRLVSTSLIEAGVDISFQEAWRAETGLDAIAQLAGRVNRNGEMAEPGRVFVFRPEHPNPREFRSMVDAAQRR